MEIDHTIIQALIQRVMKNILINKYKIQITEDIIEEVSDVAAQDILTVEEAFKNTK